MSVSALVTSIPPGLLSKERGQRKDVVVFKANRINHTPISVGRLAFTRVELRQFFLFCKDFFKNKKTRDRGGQENPFLEMFKI